MPSLRSFLRAYLGIDTVLQRDSGLAARLAHIERQQTDLLRSTTATNEALARIIAKLDPINPMVDPATKDQFFELLREVYRAPHQ